MADASVTRYELSLGSQDSTTGWPAPSYASSTIEGSIQNRGYTFILPNFGAVTAKHMKTFFTADVIAEGDLVKDAWNRYYVIKSVEPVDRFNQFAMYQCEADLRDFPAPTTTSGTWHLDSDSLTTDPRSRHKIWLDDNLTADNMELDNGVTDASVKTMFAGIPFFCPAEQLFLTLDYDGVMSIDKRSATQLTTYNNYPYAFIETVPITCTAVDKAGLTATNLLEQMEQEIRHVCTNHPIGSIRSISSTEYKSTDIGGTRLWETTVTIKYTRANDDYVPTHPHITWGPSAAPTGTYIFPNCTQIRYPNGVPDIKLLPPGRVGNIHQIMGDTSFVVELTCDLDVEHSDLTWKRTQTGGKTDKFNWQVFADIKHNAGIIAGNQPYQTLTLSANGPSFKVRLVDFTPIENGNRHTLTATFEEYVSADQSGSTYTTRWGIAT